MSPVFSELDLFVSAPLTLAELAREAGRLLRVDFQRCGPGARAHVFCAVLGELTLYLHGHDLEDDRELRLSAYPFEVSAAAPSPALLPDATACLQWVFQVLGAEGWEVLLVRRLEDVISHSGPA